MKTDRNWGPHQAPTAEQAAYLEQLRRSGVTNMYGASPFLRRRFGLSDKEAGAVLIGWMKQVEEAAS